MPIMEVKIRGIRFSTKGKVQFSRACTIKNVAKNAEAIDNGKRLKTVEAFSINLTLNFTMRARYINSS